MHFPNISAAGLFSITLSFLKCSSLLLAFLCSFVFVFSASWLLRVRRKQKVTDLMSLWEWMVKQRDTFWFELQGTRIYGKPWSATSRTDMNKRKKDDLELTQVKPFRSAVFACALIVESILKWCTDSTWRARKTLGHYRVQILYLYILKI